jgi:beta-glucanase (GH16 family)
MRLTRLLFVALLAAGAFAPRSAARAHEGAYESFPTPLPAIPGTVVYTFVGDRLDADRWHLVMHGGAGKGGPQPEFQYYTPEAVTVERNVLHISALSYDQIDPADGYDYPFLSGRVESADAYLYGRFDVALKVPVGNGLWPAVWLRTPHEFGPIRGEIDIYDGFGSHTDGFTAAIAKWAKGRLDRRCVIVENYAARTGCTRVGNPQRTRVNYAAAYHVFSVDWRPDHVTWYVDGKPYWTVTEDIPHFPMVLVMDLAVGGVQDGPPPIPMHQRFPADFEISTVAITR